MQIHTIKRATPNKKHKTVGRGGKRGKTSGKGTKGQNARAGRKFRPAMRDIIKKLPKLRGYNFASIQEKPVTVNCGDIEAIVTAGVTLTPQTCVELGMVQMEKGLFPKIKILGTGTLTKKVIVIGCDVSEVAREKIIKAGGEVR